MVKYGPAPGEPLVVAYSGGPDSTALLAACSALHPAHLYAAYVDHGIRPTAELSAELELVKRVADSLHARLCVARIRPGAIEEQARREACGPEAAARAFRYRALRSIAQRCGSSRVFLAHNADDVLETALMRLFGGSGSEGLRGMAAVNPPWHRPLLACRKAELLAYLESRDLAWSTDSTNAAGQFLRNRIRNSLVPLLNREFPGWRTGLRHTMERAELDTQALASAAAAIAFRPSSGRRAVADAATFRAAPRALQMRAMLMAIGALTGRSRSSHALAEAALRASEAGEDGCYSGGGIRLRAEGGYLVLDRGLDFPRHGGYFVVIDGPCRLRIGRLVVECKWKKGGARGILASAFRFPLVVRSRRPGDTIALPGGSKRIDVVLSEWGLDPPSRDSVPIVEDRDGIVAVLGKSFGARDRYRDGPRNDEGLGPRFSVSVKGA